MPCNTDYMYTAPATISESTYKKLVAEHAKIKAIADELTHENDMLREDILLLNEGKELDAKRLAEIQKDQVAHRNHDLKRLAKTFLKTKDAEKLAKVWNADVKKPLKDQLGFDPDDF